MNLSFTQKFPSRKKVLAGKKTYFIEKIFVALDTWCLTKFNDFDKFIESTSNELEFDNGYIMNNFNDGDNGKIHTIRKDESGRWQKGIPIHLVTETTNDPKFQFAPVIRCTGKERIKITYVDYLPKPIVQVNELLLNTTQVNELAENDGFDSVDDFFGWFDKDFEGWIIHWTPTRYDPNEIEVVEFETVTETGDHGVDAVAFSMERIESIGKNCSNDMIAPKLDCEKDFFGNEKEDEGDRLNRMNNQKR